MQMLVVYAKDLKEGFADFAEPVRHSQMFRTSCYFRTLFVCFQVTQIMVPHLRFYFHELVRAAAAEILPHLLECVQVKGQSVTTPTPNSCIFLLTPL